MQKKQSTAPSGAIAAITAVVFFLVSWFMILPQYTQNKSDYAKASNEVSAAKDKLDSLKNSQGTLDSLGTTVDSMLVAVPKGRDSGGIITSLEAIATANKTYIPSFQITGPGTSGTSAAASTSGLQAVSVVFSTSGTFESLNSFVKSIESNLKFFSIKSMTVSSSDKGISMTFQLDALTQSGS